MPDAVSHLLSLSECHRCSAIGVLPSVFPVRCICCDTAANSARTERSIRVSGVTVPLETPLLAFIQLRWLPHVLSVHLQPIGVPPICKTGTACICIGALSEEVKP